MSGTLFLLGIGPGDPELLTLKSARILGEVSHVAYVQKPGQKSVALKIAKNHIRSGAQFLSFDMPMQTPREAAKIVYDQLAKQISRLLDSGKSVAYLCEGDPFFYGSAMYIYSRLMREKNISVVPGVTSLSAAAAAIPRPLVARSERLKILPATLDDKILLAELNSAESAAILKTGCHFKRIKKILCQTNHAKNAWVIENASGSKQVVTPLDEYSKDRLPYFSIILCYKGNEDWGQQEWGIKEDP